MTSPKVRVSTDSLRYLALFESMTKARAIDLIEFMNSELIFLVKREELPLVELNPSRPIKKLSKMLNKRVMAFPYLENPEEFISHLFPPARIESVSILNSKDGRRMAYVKVNDKDRGKAIGLGGINARRASFLAKKYFDIDLVRIV